MKNQTSNSRSNSLLFMVSKAAMALALAVSSVILTGACAPESVGEFSSKIEDPRKEEAPLPDGEDEPTPAPEETPEPGATPPAPGTSPVPTPQPTPAATPEPEPTPSPSQEEAVLSRYQHLDPKRIVPTRLLEKAVLYFHDRRAKIRNAKVISVIDFSKPSSAKRLFVIDLASGEVWALHVSHGKGSDKDHDGYAESFSNVSGSNASSLGYYMTAETYQGSNGYSLRLDGLSSTNSRARARAIVIHGASYVKDANVRQGRSFGCPAVSMANYKKLIDKIKNGSVIYAERSSVVK